MTVEVSADPGSPRSQRVIRELAGLVLVTIGLSGTYWWTSAPRFNPGTAIDPWLYTALFVNFDFIYKTFGYTYYATRLPWIIPGYLLNLLFSPVAAYYILHLVFFFGGGLFAYFLV